ncbi:MAG: hypothetical protein COB33_005050 [Thiotrichaceae bacterium]|nr:hypothetical protein [Thiotrichaceae bacterium]
MKILSLASLIFFSSYLHADSIIVSGNKLEIDNQCRLKVTNKDSEIKLIKLNLPKSSDCKFVVYNETNVINFQVIGNSYMFFVELPTGGKDDCLTKYVAVAEKDGAIKTSATYARSGTCPPNLEIDQFLYFAHKMKVLN